MSPRILGNELLFKIEEDYLRHFFMPKPLGKNYRFRGIWRELKKFLQKDSEELEGVEL